MSGTSYRIAGATGDWELVMGLEVHAPVISNAKRCSGAATAVGASPNTQVSLVDAAMPGMLPVINGHVVEQAVKTGLGLNAQINPWSRFDRKNYFYPDLPQGYQISQFQFPIVGEGEIECEREDGSRFTVGIERLHLEQDAGKSIHDLDPSHTYVDLNRSGVALMEIVSRPHIRTPDEASAYVSKLRTILRYLGTCGGDMEKGQLRADVNVSVCRPGDYEKFRETGDFSHLGTRCEIKNVNSLRFIRQAIEFEAKRQVDIIEEGGTINQETRLFDANTGVTRSMRSKEEAHDYRYFPDPDLLPLELNEDWIEMVREHLPELPDQKRERFAGKFGIDNIEYLDALTAEREFADEFETAFVELFETNDLAQDVRLAIYQHLHVTVDYPGKETAESVVEDFLAHNLGFDAEDHRKTYGKDAQALANMLCGQVRAKAAEAGVSAAEVARKIDVAGLVKLIKDGTISGKIAKDVFEILWEEGGDPAKIVESRGLKQVTDTGAIEAVIDQLIADNPDQAASVKDKPKAMGWFVGQVMKAMQGKANPQAVNEILRKKLLG